MRKGRWLGTTTEVRVRRRATIARFVEPAHMRVARGEIAVPGGKAWIVLNGHEQLRRRLVKLAFEEIGSADRGHGLTHPLARAQAQRGLDMLDREIGLTNILIMPLRYQPRA